MRGNLREKARMPAPCGSIPACAGEPESGDQGRYAEEVYPRVCGGTRERRSGPLCRGGLSPRVRGNRHSSGMRWPVSRSIPACAGEPRGGRAVRRDDQVYPRVCGGTRWASSFCCVYDGLSPRVRGNPPAAIKETWRKRSIPACAGEPPVRVKAHSGQRVYPRVCGGTATRHDTMTDTRGLSPRVRGNRARALPAHVMGRSIPACAGEPS